MHIIAAITAALGVVLFVLFRMQQASRAVSDVTDAADNVRGFLRRLSWSRKANVNPLDAVTDPREAAAAMMVAIAEADGATSGEEKAVMSRLMSEHFGASAAQCEELIARGRWLVHGRVNVGETLRRLKAPIVKSCSPAEQRDLVAMLQAVAIADGRCDEAVDEDIRRFARTLQG